MAIDASGIAALPLKDKAAIFISSEEGFISKPMYDVNHWRVGFGSDTITFPDGSYREVRETDRVTREQAQMDLTRRIDQEKIPLLRTQIGQDAFNGLGWPALVGLLSLSYNYGKITHPSIITAAKSKNPNYLADTVVSATYDDNKKLPMNIREALRHRRKREADFIRMASTNATVKPAEAGLSWWQIVLIASLVGAMSGKKDSGNSKN